MLRTFDGGIVNDVVVRVRVGVGVRAVAEIARIVVVEEVVVPGFAIGLDLARARRGSLTDRADARLGRRRN